MTPSEAVENADWIGPRLHPFAQDVGSVVPTGFAAYARILHPAWTPWAPKPSEVRWSDVAAWSGRVIHPEVQFHAIAQPAPGRQVGPSPWSEAPRPGTLSTGQATALAQVLPNHTTTSDACWFCLWEGYGYFAPDGIAPFIFAVRKGPRLLTWLRFRAARRRLRRRRPRPVSGVRVNMPYRGYLLFTGSVKDAAGWEDGPNLWWPDDRAWCVASEIDLPYTYVGGSTEVIAEIMKHPALEALPAELGDGVTYDSDKLNS
jgi:hypothetical protein